MCYRRSANALAATVVPYVSRKFNVSGRAATLAPSVLGDVARLPILLALGFNDWSQGPRQRGGGDFIMLSETDR